MKIYAVRDRMIDYFLTPFAAPNDQEVMASLSNEINRPDNINAIAQAPHHFELYLLGEIDENGTIFPKKELICDCSSLVRARRESPVTSARETPLSTRENAIRAGLGNGVIRPHSETVSKSAELGDKPD